MINSRLFTFLSNFPTLYEPLHTDCDKLNFRSIFFFFYSQFKTVNLGLWRTKKVDVQKRKSLSCVKFTQRTTRISFQHHTPHQNDLKAYYALWPCTRDLSGGTCLCLGLLSCVLSCFLTTLSAVGAFSWVLWCLYASCCSHFCAILILPQHSIDPYKSKDSRIKEYLFSAWLYPLSHFFSVSGKVMVIIVLLASLNSCTNPWIYLAFSDNLQRRVTRCFRSRGDSTRAWNASMTFDSDSRPRHRVSSGNTDVTRIQTSTSSGHNKNSFVMVDRLVVPKT